MKNEREKDSLEQLFSKYLSDEQAAENGWNVPSDELFLDALNEMDEESKRKPFPIFWFSLGLLLVVTLGFMLWTTSRIHSLDQELNQLEHKISAFPIASSTESSEEQIVTKPNITSEAAALSQEKTKNLKSNNTPQSTKLDRQTKMNKRGNVKSKSTEQDPTEPNTEPIQNNSIPPTINTIAKNDPLQSLTISPITLLNAPALEVSSLNTKLDFESLPPQDGPEEIEPVRSKEWTPHIVAGTRLSSFSKKNISAEGPEILGYSENQLGFSAGIGVSKDLGKRWSMQHRLTYSQVNNKSYYEDELIFDIEKQSVDAQGDNWYKADQEVLTPLGATSQSEPFSMSDAVIEDQEIMQKRTDVKLGFRMIEWSSGLQYELLQKNNWQLSIGSNFDLRYVFDYNQWANIDVTKDQELIMNNELNNKDRADLNQWLIGVSANTTLQYHWSQKLSTAIEIGGYRSLNSLRNNDTKVQTYLRDIRINLVTGFKF